ncbi:MAG: DUF1559 domain-containing protein, partial [Planctomycetia bacterium]
MRTFSKQRAWRFGFTLIELLVVVGVVGVLASLALSAVFAARAAAYRARCANNLRQIGVAMNAYLGETGYFPLSSCGTNHTSSAFVRLLPYLGETALYDSYNFTTDYGASLRTPNKTVFQTSVAVYLCPAMGVPPSLRPGNSYHLNDANQLWASPGKGDLLPAFYCYVTKATVYEDGLAKTAAVSERLMGDGDPSSYTMYHDS